MRCVVRWFGTELIKRRSLLYKASVCCERVFRLPSLLFVVSDINHLFRRLTINIGIIYRCASNRTWITAKWRWATLPGVPAALAAAHSLKLGTHSS